jgi:hypothetical protein
MRTASPACLPGLDAGDPEGEVGAAYLAKELLRDSYLAADALEARRRLVAFYDHCNASEVPELTRLARTIARWEVPILRWHRTRLTNAATEGTNLVIKNIKRLGFGFRNFDNYRLRLLLRCGAHGTIDTSHQYDPANRASARSARRVAESLEERMTVEIHVDGRVAQGMLSTFAEGLERYVSYARDHGYTVPRVLQGLSGPMNSVRLVYTYDDLAAYGQHEARTLHDAGYAAAASGMELVEGTITYSLFRTVE